ncbi:hypothetical protein MNBD_DELTA03-189 [hydrothermal vent metagenome]|uniref:Uncharacterized protein n=1 Tax=hydrothermal vent metagenome TaxID=652676 RepID=A0A3B0VJ11_9ZZZZ
MNSEFDNDQKQLAGIAKLFNEAEIAIKEIEDYGSELVVPAVNQLRYCGNHLVRYLSDTSNKEELSDSIKHCKRAAYDAYESAIVYHLFEFKKFKDDYRRVQITPVISDYADIQQKIIQARNFIRNNNESKTRGEFYKDGRKHLQLLAGNVEKLNSNRDELNKAIRKERTTLLSQVVGGIAAIIAIVTFIIVYSPS